MLYGEHIYRKRVYMRTTNYNSELIGLQYLNATQSSATDLLGLSTNKANENLNIVAQKYAAAKASSTTATGSVNSVISSEASNLNKVYEQVKQSGNKEAIDGFREAVMGYSKAGDAAGLKNFFETGVKLVNDKNTASLINELAVADKISKQISASSATQFLNQASAAYSQSGLQAMTDYAKAAGHIISGTGTNSLQISSAKAAVLGNLTTLWKAVSAQSGVTTAQIKTQLSDISSNVLKAGDLKAANDYLNTKIQQVKTASGTKVAKD